MNATPFIPPATVRKLKEPIPQGQRHNAAKDIAISLIGNGLSPDAVLTELRGKFPEVSSDSELVKIVEWAVNKKPTPSGFSEASSQPSGRLTSSRPYQAPVRPFVEAKPVDPTTHCKWWLSGAEMTPDALASLSPSEIPLTAREWPDLVFRCLYSPTEHINIVCNHTIADGKANPQGGGKSMTPFDWEGWIAKNGVPQSDAGAWMRPNPCAAVGSGSSGAITDDDITAHRFMLIESDVLPLASQLAFYSKIKLPIALIQESGGKSAHAWVRVDSSDVASYRTITKRILTALKPFGFDESNKNPSRLSRLPGAQRKIGASNGGLQRLLWLNPHCEPLTESALLAFEESLALPALEDQPFKRVIFDSHDRYTELYNNRGKLGVPSGVAALDRDSGGFKPGQMTVIAGETNAGKSTVAINFVNAALSVGIGVALFTLEMDREEIADLLVSMNCEVNRNAFNTGEFKEGDWHKIANHSARMAKYPLYIDDAPSLTAGQIRRRVMQLNAEKRIGLVVIDYAQIVSPDDSREPREQQVARIAREFRGLAKESRLPLIVLSQLNDEGKLRESRVLAHEAHNVMQVEVTGDDSHPGLNLRIYKGRRIPKKTYDLNYEPQFCRIAKPGKIETNRNWSEN